MPKHLQPLWCFALMLSEVLPIFDYSRQHYKPSSQKLSPHVLLNIAAAIHILWLKCLIKPSWSRHIQCELMNFFINIVERWERKNDKFLINLEIETTSMTYSETKKLTRACSGSVMSLLLHSCWKGRHRSYKIVRKERERPDRRYKPVYTTKIFTRKGNFPCSIIDANTTHYFENIVRTETKRRGQR